MDNKYNKDFENVLQDPELNHEIGPDELAVHTAGLTHPDDLELERILAEDWDSVPDQEIPEMTPEEALNQFLYGDDDEASTQTIPEITEEETYEQEYPTEEPTRVIPVASGEEYYEEESGEELLPAEEYSEEMIPAEEAEEEYEEEPLENPNRKGRPKMKKGYGLLGIPHIISTAIWLAITALIGISLGRVLWVCCADVMAFGKPEVTAFVTVTEEDDIESVAQKLADANLIRYPGLFTKFAEITDKDDRIKTGVHELGSHLDYNAMINNMVYSGNTREEIEITFPEGYNCAQIFKLLEEKGVCSAAELEEWAANGELKEYWFLEGIERGDKYCLEGYLSPDTYRFYTNSEPQVVLEKFLNAFETGFTDIMKEDFETMKSRYAKLMANRGYSSDYIKEHELTLHQVVTIASVVERETANDAESYDIASVFYNRITNPKILTMGSDATVYYAIGDFFREKKELEKSDIESDSPYNTRKAQGIPPGPICNPGAYSLYAALDPNDTNYHYFLYDVTVSQHLFSATYDEHQQKVRELGA